MTSYNIDVVKPEDEEHSYYYNALQLQPAGMTYGHHSCPPPYQSSPITTSDQSGYTYSHISTSNFVNNPYSNRSQLTHLGTSASQFLQGVASASVSEMDYTHGRRAWHGTNSLSGHSSTLQHSPAIYQWTVRNEFGGDISPSHVLNSSPLSQGCSPLTPITPLSTVEPSPTVSSLPSPGSQGSNEVLHLAPSPVRQSPASVAASEMHAFNHAQLANVYSHHHGSDTHLYVSGAFARTDAPGYTQAFDVNNQANLGALTRRHSHSGSDRPQQDSIAPRPQTTSMVDIPLIPRDEYRFHRWRLPGPIVPQTQYQPHSVSDRKRYVDEYELLPPIYFERLDGPGIGITLPECVTHRFRQLKGQDDPLLECCGPSISVRINWAGYGPWSRQIPTRNFKVPQGPITRTGLAKNIARSVERFINEHIARPLQPGSDPLWQVGPGKIEFSDLVLLSIHHVSRGSWQANLCLSQSLEHVLNKSHVLQ